MNYNFIFVRLVTLICRQPVISEKRFDYMSGSYLKLLMILKKVVESAVIPALTPYIAYLNISCKWLETTSKK